MTVPAALLPARLGLQATLEKIGLSFLKAFASSVIVVVIGVATQPTVRGTAAVYIAALMAGIAAGVATLQLYVPALSFRRWIPDPYGQLIDTFSHGFLGAFLVSIIAFFHQQDLSTWKSAVTAALVGGVAAGARVFQNGLTPGAAPIAPKGILAPDPRPVPAAPPQVPTPPATPAAVTEAPVAPQAPPEPPPTP